MLTGLSDGTGGEEVDQQLGRFNRHAGFGASFRTGAQVRCGNSTPGMPNSGFFVAGLFGVDVRAPTPRDLARS